MKIVHCVENYFPSIGGMQEVVKQLSEHLVQWGHHVTVATRSNAARADKINGVAVEGFDIHGNPEAVTTDEEKRYVRFLIDSGADVITFFAAQQWATDLALPFLKEIKARKVSVPTGYSGLLKPAYAGYFERMKRYIHDYDMNVFLSENYRDINFARANGVTRLTVIPNGAAEEEFSRPVPLDVRERLAIEASGRIILHVGSYTGRKGHREALEIFLAAKTGRAVLLLIGNDMRYFYRQFVKRPLLAARLIASRLRGKRVIARSFPREFTVAAYQQADLFLFPSQVECSPIVLFECAAAGLPFLSTTAGNAAEIAQWTGGGKILPGTQDENGYTHADISGSARLLENSIGDLAAMKQMGARARREWLDRFTWRKIARTYEALYSSLAST